MPMCHWQNCSSVHLQTGQPGAHGMGNTFHQHQTQLSVNVLADMALLHSNHSGYPRSISAVARAVESAGAENTSPAGAQGRSVVIGCDEPHFSFSTLAPHARLFQLSSVGPARDFWCDCLFSPVAACLVPTPPIPIRDNGRSNFDRRLNFDSRGNADQEWRTHSRVDIRCSSI